MTFSAPTLAPPEIMDAFYVSSEKRSPTQAPHVVHKAACEQLPASTDRLYLGHFNSGATALTRARSVYANATACAACCPECNLLRDPEQLPP